MEEELDELYEIQDELEEKEIYCEQIIYQLAENYEEELENNKNKKYKFDSLAKNKYFKLDDRLQLLNMKREIIVKEIRNYKLLIYISKVDSQIEKISCNIDAIEADNAYVEDEINLDQYEELKATSESEEIIDLSKEINGYNNIIKLKIQQLKKTSNNIDRITIKMSKLNEEIKEEEKSKESNVLQLSNFKGRYSL